MRLNKKGLTLVELITVLVVLILIFLLAVNKVNDITERAENNSVKADSITFMKAVNDYFNIKNASSLENRYEGIYTVSELIDLGISVSGTKPSDGFILNLDNKTKYGCLTYKHRKAIIIDNDVTSVVSGSCNIKNGYNSNMKSFIADYSGAEEQFKVAVTGKYLVEVWGASGGNANSDYTGGYGGYSRGYADLTKGEILYINVGGAGQGGCTTTTCTGGYNGGGNAAGRSDVLSGSGGGATSISFVTGNLADLSSNIENILIVAGGGGGSSFQEPSYAGNGGSGGGAYGNSGTNLIVNYASGLGGTQTEGGTQGLASRGQAGSFGKGGNGTQFASGGGGGYYGGGSANQSGAGGGSGYIGNERLYESTMYCYECQVSVNPGYKTISVDQVSNNPNSFSAKKGHGYARIIFIE